MAKARELRRRIKSVENTRQITKTMEMVATSRLKRAQDRVVATRPYAAALTELIASLYDPALEESFPLLRQLKGEPTRVALVLITSNRGLCGGFNANLIKEARRRIENWEARGVEVELHCVGRKGAGHFKYLGRLLAQECQDIGDRPTVAHATDLVEPLMARFEAGELDIVEVIFAKFNNPLSTPPTILPLLPIRPPAEGRKGGRMEGEGGGRSDVPTFRPTAANYILRPSAEEIVRRMLPECVRNGMYRALVETAASEHGARRTAMKNATENAGEMIDVLRRNFNRARQAQITQEIAEIVGGAEALKG